ncbi:SDR family NAD(P)-dependent oxidoreductase [Thermostaphylospora chromogena]|uniref:Short-chain dehydrogenase n=1 Tax=Thermostaphylospora chromogena TaxID=35622 RepID=A0A1H1D2T8_9ACTN|nr:SDR family NAD(P)-dependent oxidoreductase [Thermostaphylospora chromogena]SDQ70851.1 Short-chain dehydrogenase [Thermostaphylospora chromogena]
MICIVTGVGAGIGGVVAESLARQGHQVVLVGRTPEKVAAVAERATVVNRKPLALTCDYTDLDQVRKLADTISGRFDHIDVLINNAGVMTTRRTLTRNGHEVMFQVNHLAPFLLTTLLLDRLRDGRVVTTGSRAAKTGRLDLTDLDRQRRRWSGWLQYGDTKQANALFTVELARRGIAATCVHPGVIKTGFASGTFLMKLVHHMPGMGRDVAEGAAPILALATGPAGLAHPGRYFARDKLERVPRTMRDPELARRLWEVSETLVRPWTGGRTGEDGPRAAR